MEDAERRIVVPGETPGEAASNAAVEALSLAQKRLHVEDAKFDAIMEVVYAIEALTDTVLAVVVSLSGMEKDTRHKIQEFVARSAEKRMEARGAAMPQPEEGEDNEGHEE